MAPTLLSGYRALELTDEKGFICGKILATLGVEVIKVERPGGDPSRLLPPFAGDVPHPERSLYWLAFNTDKRSLTLDLEKEKGRELFLKLVARTDFLIESFPPGYLDRLGLGYEELSRLNPRLIMTSITPFGQQTPYRGYKGSELIVSALSGVMLTNGDPDRPPLREGPDSITFEGNAAAALGTIIAHLHRELTGEGQHIDVSLQEVAAKRTSTNWIPWEFDRRLIPRSSNIRTVGSRATQWIWECRDGYLFWPFMGSPVGSQGNHALAGWMADEGFGAPLLQVEDWDNFDMAALSPQSLEEMQQAIRQFFLRHSKSEIARESLRRGVNAAVISTPADVLQNEQLAARAYWVRLQCVDEGKPLSFPGYFIRSNETENRVRQGAPRVGEANEEILGSELGLSPEELEELRREGVI
ncbi:MAG: hypothetical protein DRI26_07445 [Chloroflexi bacterium]|nr:MAG: hypothetical protein DRI26_07445 [Chloroflexota bacterium]